MKPTNARLPAMLLMFLLSACDKENSNAPSGPSGGKPALAGTLRLPGGKPAADAVVKLYSVDYVPGRRGAPKASAVEDLAFLTRTDAAGHFSVDSLERGEYNVLAEGGGLVSFQDSVFLSPGANAEFSDTLEAAGAVYARVALQPNHDPRTAIVHVLGTSAFANVDKDGRFTLKGMAAGLYSLVIETTEDKYTPLYAGLTVRAGTADTLAAPLTVPFTGIPVVTGIKVRLDTLAGVAHISWNPVDYRSFKSFVVLRRAGNSLDPRAEIIGVTRDTDWTDTLFDPSMEYGLSSGALPSARKLEYQVGVRNLSLQDGEAYGSDTLDAVPPSWVSTHIQFSAIGADGGEGSLNDTVRVVAFFRNQGRAFRSLAWDEQGVAGPVREAALKAGAHSGFDTLTVVGKALGARIFFCRILDDGGKPWTRRFDLRFVASPPTADAGNDTLVARGDLVELRGRAQTRFGRIAKWEWDMGATGAFVASPDGKTTLHAPDSAGLTLCVLRVTNEDGEQDSDTVSVRSSLVWRKVADAPVPGNFGQLIAFHDRLWLIGGLPESGESGTLFSSADGISWRKESDDTALAGRVNLAACVYRDSLWIIGGQASASESNNGFSDIWRSADGVDWTKVSVQGSDMKSTYVAAFGDKLWIALEYAQDFFTSDDGKNLLRQKSPAPNYAAPASFTALPGRLLFSATSGNDHVVWGWNGVSWDVGTRLGAGKLHGGWIAYHGRVWIFGGSNGENFQYDDRVFSSPDGLSWQEELPLPRNAGRGVRAALFNDAIWMIDQGEIFRAR